MKLKFDPSLEFQQDAINAVINVFEGQPIAQAGFELSHGNAAGGLLQSDLGVGNNIILPDDHILANVHKTQEANDIEKTTDLQGREFSIEMETGTGKTYVYLRTIFELNKTYGFKKFIIVVPSVAIREGVLKSIDVMKGHFKTLYDNAPFDHFVYDSKRLGKVRQFSSGNQIQIMIINIQAFVKDVPDKPESEMTEDELKKLNVINRENDRMSGRRPIEFIQATNPFVIIDEPQSVDNTAKSKRAIANLKPAATLRYSATHRNPYNLLYKLDPIKAYDLRLVKRIEVASIRSDDSFNDAYVKLLKTDNKNGIKAQIEIHKEGPSGPKVAKMWVKQSNDLFIKSDERASYLEGYIVQNIDCTPGSEGLEFNSGRWLDVGQEIGGLGDDIMKAQVFETVEQHFKKERALKGKGIKNHIVNARDRRELKFRKEVHLSEDFIALWDKIKHRTRYRVSFETSDLIAKAVARIGKVESIKPIRISMTRVDLGITDAGIDTDTKLEEKAIDAEPVKVLPDILAYLQKETELTRHTLVEILKKSGRLDEFKINPQSFMASVGKEISRALHDLMLEGIQYEQIADQHWEMSRIEQEAEEGIVRYLSNLYQVQNRDKALFDAIEYDSEVERQFAQDLDTNDNVRMFVKLPGWFKIDTPIGPYNPDWAFVTDRDEKLYFVRETKSTLDSEDRRSKENQKIVCGKKHFETLGVDYDVVTSLAEVVM